MGELEYAGRREYWGSIQSAFSMGRGGGLVMKIGWEAVVGYARKGFDSGLWNGVVSNSSTDEIDDVAMFSRLDVSFGGDPGRGGSKRLGPWTEAAR